jgi:hypothetical protein
MNSLICTKIKIVIKLLYKATFLERKWETERETNLHQMAVKIPFFPRIHKQQKSLTYLKNSTGNPLLLPIIGCLYLKNKLFFSILTKKTTHLTAHDKIKLLLARINGRSIKK